MPPLPQGPVGLPNPLAPPNALPGANLVPGQPLPGQETPPAPYSLALPQPGLGVTTLQAYNPNAPAVLILPQVTIGERFTDNANYTATSRTAAAETRLLPGVTISADTPRLQGVLTGNLEGDVSVPTNTDLNRIFGNLYANGHGTIVPDKLFVDAKSSISLASTVAGLGFTSPTLLPKAQQTQVFVNNISPYFRESIDGLVDTELRYTFGSTNFGGNTAGAVVPGSITSNNLSTGVLNEGTFTAATGQNFERALSRLTVDASNFNSSATTRNNQFSAYDDFEYRFLPEIAALGRIGYQNIHYPFSPAATFVGPTWLVGGRVGLAADYAYLSLEYGVQQGVYGFTGSAFYQITPTMTLRANLSQGISSPSQYLQTTLASSTLNPYGAIVDQYSGLPTAFYNPGLGLTNNVYRQHLLNIGISDIIGDNTYSLYGFLISQQSLTFPTTTTPTKSIGANFTWGRAIRPDLNSSAALGFYNTSNAIGLTNTASVGTINTITANLGLNYLLTQTLTGSVLYTFSYQSNGAVVTGSTGNIVANSLQFLLTKTF
ncbi:MAG TPA: hypothetical protein VFQ82_11370 [Stellaceae bacterium]|nr:hypothetical protein [Stellaceae bacterium]